MADTRRTLHFATQVREIIPPSPLNARNTRTDGGGGNDDNNSDDDGDTTMGVALIMHPSDPALEEVLRCREEINELRACLAPTETKAELGRRALEEMASLRGEEMKLLRRRLAEAGAVAEARRRKSKEESREEALSGGGATWEKGVGGGVACHPIHVRDGIVRLGGICVRP